MVKRLRVAVIDEIADTGETLSIVAQRARQRGAIHVVTAALVSHTWANPQPDKVALLTDALVLFPWDEQVFTEDHWQANPEITAALKLQEKKSLK
jgi:hypoxanthine phosphoribosyltransferase